MLIRRGRSLFRLRKVGKGGEAARVEGTVGTENGAICGSSLSTEADIKAG
jgi:hypothetical protein